MTKTQKLYRDKQVAKLKTDAALNATRENLRRKREDMISSVADTVAQDWYRRAIHDPRTMGLYWRKPRTGENAACPIIDFTAPNEDFSRYCDISPALSRDKVRSVVAQAMLSLPMLSASWFGL